MIAIPFFTPNPTNLILNRGMTPHVDVDLEGGENQGKESLDGNTIVICTNFNPKIPYP